ncbi:uncharacterized protein PHALS_12519 [Plasmopara halstedii]|uniref:Uncharacterized protein n=1 Tax=Plasmopara halstedii TaxID=4781 RepID=A0A0P1AM36_PLAHL|nr:uncharacterized protein PHALS_12519 [Plasmopara halstedii]CEG42226.1 hypothetical protein PHALS_12519 [Plasmopara halstedii]|eukprot:XP_024578595.1 hypothetical protein PHALS_12519 [Plasmopara halstedii]
MKCVLLNQVTACLVTEFDQISALAIVISSELNKTLAQGLLLLVRLERRKLKG